MFEVKVNTDELDRYLGGIIGRLDNPEPLMAKISTELVSESEQQFRDEKESDGKPWPDLAPSTKEWRRKKGKEKNRKLQVSGALASSVQGYHNKTEAGVLAGSADSEDYAAIHLFGGEAGRINSRVLIPARRYLPIKGDPDNAELSDSVSQALLILAKDYFSDGLHSD